MSHNFLLGTTFHKILLEIDLDTAARFQAEGCSHCGGSLHQAHYPRIGFGISSEIAPLYAKRQSFCCSVCRHRATPPSLRFLGRRRYVFTAFLLLGALRLSPSEDRCDRLARRFGVHISLSTWKRWVSWWRQRFPVSRFWTAAKARFSLPFTVVPLPRALLKQFSGTSLSHRLMPLLRFLSPLTIGVV